MNQPQTKALIANEAGSSCTNSYVTAAGRKRLATTLNQQGV